MEKVNTRSALSKQNNNIDLKNKPDAANRHSRFPRYKPENVLPHTDTRYKSNSFRYRESVDKRFCAQNGALCESYRDEVVHSSDRRNRQKSKNVNLNYLLNFTLPPLEGNNSKTLARNHRKLPKYNKEQFLQANCQFVARDNGNYLLHCKNPDNLVDWSLIEEVRVASQECPSCPICLFSPVAAKITRCGHIYCWPCILHYLALTDKTWNKCPICFEAVHGSDLRSVTYVTQAVVKSGHVLNMRLMKREKGFMFPIPAGHESPSSVFRMHEAESVTKYQKLLLASKLDIQEIVNRERKELELYLVNEKDEPEACFILSALQLLVERETELNKSRNSDLRNALHQERSHVEEETKCTHHDKELANDNIVSENQNEASSVGSLGADSSGSCHNKNKSTFYFYQADDGQHIYLHWLNVKMLVKEFGSLEESPPVIEGRVLELENISMTEPVRSRLRYLQHIPLACEFQVAELNIDPYLSKTTIKEFQGDTANRCKLRKKKAFEEKKREDHIKKVENMKLGKYPRARYDLESSNQFPACESRNVSSSNEREYEVQYPSFGISNLTIDESDKKADSPPTASFAALLRDGHMPFNHSVPSHQRNIVEQPAAKNNVLDEDEAHVPEYKHSFSSAIQDVLDIAINQKPKGDEQSTSKKKKKAKNRILFSTSMNRNQ